MQQMAQFQDERIWGPRTCRGFEEAMKVTTEYLGERRPRAAAHGYQFIHFKTSERHRDSGAQGVNLSRGRASHEEGLMDLEVVRLASMANTQGSAAGPRLVRKTTAVWATCPRRASTVCTTYA